MSAKEILKKYEIEINKNNFDLLIPFISSDCKFWFTSGTFQGHEQCRATFEKTWKKIKEEKYWLTDVDWLVESEGAAVCTYTFNWTGFIEEKYYEGKGRGTSCFRKEQSEWKIIHEHLSHFPK